MLEPLLNKIAGLQACNFITKRLQHNCFPLNIVKFVRTAFLQNKSGGCFCKHPSKHLLNISYYWCGHLALDVCTTFTFSSFQKRILILHVLLNTLKTKQK